MASNKAVTVFKLQDSRGRKALEQFLPEYEGKVITDRYAVYNIYDSQNRQICLAHLRRDFKRFAHSKNLSLSKVGQSLMAIIDLVFATYNCRKTGKINRIYYLRRMRKIKKRMLYYLKLVSAIEKCEQARRVANNILKSFDMMWLFVEDEAIEPTNNLAERQIKHHVKYRKNSFFTWSDRGERFIERTKSIFATAKLQNINPFQEHCVAFSITNNFSNNICFSFNRSKNRSLCFCRSALSVFGFLVFVFVTFFTTAISLVNFNYLAKRVNIFIKQFSNLFSYSVSTFISNT